MRQKREREGRRQGRERGGERRGERQREKGRERGEEGEGGDGRREGDGGAKNFVFTRILHEMY